MQTKEKFIGLHFGIRSIGYLRIITTVIIEKLKGKKKPVNVYYVCSACLRLKQLQYLGPMSYFRESPREGTFSECLRFFGEEVDAHHLTTQGGSE